MGTGSIYNCGKNADFPHFPLSVVKLETTLITNKTDHCALWRRTFFMDAPLVSLLPDYNCQVNILSSEV